MVSGQGAEALERALGLVFHCHNYAYIFDTMALGSTGITQ